MNIELNKQIDPTTLHQYRFYLNYKFELILQAFVVYRKIPPKRVWKFEAKYDGLDIRSSTLPPPEITEELQNEAIAEFVKEIKLKNKK